jgi:crotonobetainyl-CoA:carnitine CoA-transferase CaiB-like acyl-CoA transferase
MAGNRLSLQLADFGGDVIKIEPPEGDPLRDWKDIGCDGAPSTAFRPLQLSIGQPWPFGAA